MALINCKECGREISDTAESCPHCGFKEHHEEVTPQTQSVVAAEPVLQPVNPQPVNPQPIQAEVQPQTINQLENQQVAQTEINQPTMNQQTSVNQSSQTPSFFKNKTALISIGVVLVALIVGIVIATSIYNKIQYDRRPVRVDISMTSFYGDIEEILDEFGLDFDLVTMGANCYTGVQRNEFSTEKYGILHTEFRYCYSNETLILRVYNDENDQPLRDPKPGEVATFDKYGEKISSSKSDF